MTNTSKKDSQGPETDQSGRYSFKSEGRREHMLRLHTAGIAFGPRPKHGVRALADRLRRGLDPETPLALLHSEFRDQYVADLGGKEACSAMELGVCERLADLDLIRGMLNAQRDASRRLSLKRLEVFAATVSRNAAAYIQAVKTIGPGRRQRPADQTIIVKKFAEAPLTNTGE